MKDGGRELPAHVGAMLSKQDEELNKLPTERLLELYRLNVVKVFVDKGLAIQAASSGVPTSGFTVALSLLFPVLLLSVPFAWYFLSWPFALAAVVLAVIVFRVSRARIVARVREYALDNPNLLDLLVAKGVMWFEHVPGSSLVDETVQVPAHSNPSAHGEQRKPSPAEKMFGNGKTPPPFFDLPSGHDGWHDVLDCIVEKLTPTMCAVFPNEAESFVQAKCELIGYAAAYEGKLVAGIEIDRMVWNTLVSSVENRVFRRIDVSPDLSEYAENADGSRTFISQSSVYVTHMRDLERIIDRQYLHEDYDNAELLGIFSPREGMLNEDVTAEFNRVFEKAVLLCSDELIPTLDDFV